jgi:catechol O-methyltransferase
VPQPKDGREQALHEHIMSLPREGLQGNPQAVIKTIDDYSNSNAKMMTFKPSKIAASRAAMEEMSPPPKVLVEMGTYVGNSAVAWGSILKDLNSGKTDGVKVYCLEFNPEYIKIASDVIALAGVDDVVQIVPGAASDSLRKLKAEGKLDKIDVLFLDHFQQYYLPDLQVCEELGLFHEGSIILADNMDAPDPPEYVKYVRAGGRGGAASVKYDSKMVRTRPDPERPSGVEISKVIKV